MGEQPTRADEGLEQKAYHEAGHAAVAWHCGQRFQYVRIGDSPGESHVALEPLDSPDAEACRKRAMITLAGEAAWATITKSFPLSIAFVTTDWGKAREWLAKADPQADQMAIFQFLNADVKPLVADLWPAIHALAEALLERRHLNYHEASMVMAEANSAKERKDARHAGTA